jgi:hypothetical protein
MVLRRDMKRLSLLASQGCTTLRPSERTRTQMPSMECRIASTFNGRREQTRTTK